MANTTGLQLRSLITRAASSNCRSNAVTVPEPAADEVVVRVEGSPINPSDLGLLTGPAASARRSSPPGSGDDVVVTAKVPEAAHGRACGAAR